MIKRNIPIAAALLAAIAATAVAAVAQTGGGPPGSGVDRVETIPDQAREALAVLDAPRRGDDTVPADAVGQFGQEARFGSNTSLSRKALDTVANDLYVIPAEDRVCAALTVGDGASIACPATDSVADGTVAPATVTLDGGAIGVYGIVPNGVESIAVGTGASSSEVVEVVDNAYLAVLPQGTPLRDVSYTGPSGVVEFPIHDPAVSFEEE